MWGLTGASLVALIGVFVNLGWNYYNSHRTSQIRTNTSKLDYFNSHARRPLEAPLAIIDEIIDAADDLLLSALDIANRTRELDSVRRKFHGARRAIARRLMDIQRSALIDGHDWLSVDEWADSATDAFERAMNSGDNDEFAAALRDFVAALTRLRHRIRERLDQGSERLMK